MAEKIQYSIPLATNLRLLREQKNLSRSKTGRIIGRDERFLAALERGEKLPSLTTLSRLCGLFEVTPDDLLMRDLSLHIPKVPYKVIGIPGLYTFDTSIKQVFDKGKRSLSLEIEVVGPDVRTVDYNNILLLNEGDRADFLMTFSDILNKESSLNYLANQPVTAHYLLTSLKGVQRRF